VTRSYRPGDRKRSRQQHAHGIGWGSMLLGLFIGLSVTALVLFYDIRLPENYRLNTGNMNKSVTKTKGADEPPPIKYEFYKILSEIEVVVPDEPASKATQLARPVGEGNYVLQAGSFKKMPDADRRKASIALLGEQAAIQTVTISGGEVWHRVRLGPFTSINKIQALRQKLGSEGIDTILIRLRNK